MSGHQSIRHFVFDQEAGKLKTRPGAVGAGCRGSPNSMHRSSLSLSLCVFLIFSPVSSVEIQRYVSLNLPLSDLKNGGGGGELTPGLKGKIDTTRCHLFLILILS